MTDSATPTLRDLLVNYFNENTGVAAQAMYEELKGYQGWGDNKDTYYPSEFDDWATPQDILFYQVDTFGGEDQGSNYWTVYHFTKGDESVYIKFHGWYASYDGAEYEGFNVVTPKEKTVMVYE